MRCSPTRRFGAYRDYTVIVVLLGTGLRLGELVNLRWDDVDLHNLMLTVFGKKRQQSSVPITPKLEKELCEFRVFAERQFQELPEYVFTDQHASALCTHFQRSKLLENVVYGVQHEHSSFAGNRLGNVSNHSA